MTLHADGDCPLKVLHLSFHSGCIKEIEAVAHELDMDLTSWLIPKMTPYFFDPDSTGNVVYNMGHERAERIFNKHKDFFEDFDLIITSDTAPLSRIFLQNNWKKPLIIWVCNRFDYYDRASLDCSFPDSEYYELIKKATKSPNIRIVAYTQFEKYYAKTKGIDIGNLLIKPGVRKNSISDQSLIPEYIDKSTTFFLPPYHNETKFCDLQNLLFRYGIPAYSGKYNGPGDLAQFKGIIHLPYAWSNLALFENIQQGIPYFIPSRKFVRQLAKEKNYFFCQGNFFFSDNLAALSEWYCRDNKDVITYFDSWTDLIQKINRTNFEALRSTVKQQGEQHRELMLLRWKNLLESFDFQSIHDDQPLE